MRVAQYTQIDFIGKCMLMLLCVVYVMYIHLQFYVKWSDLCSYELNEVLRPEKEFRPVRDKSMSNSPSQPRRFHYEILWS